MHTPAIAHVVSQVNEDLVREGVRGALSIPSL